MSKIIILLLTIITVVPVASTSAQEPTNLFTSSTEDLLCSDVLPGNSVVASFFNTSKVDTQDIKRSDSLQLPIRVSNSNTFPVQDLTTHLRLFKITDSQGQMITPQLYATKVINKGTNLESDESLELNHTFTVPAYLTNGTYRLSTHVESYQRFTVSGTKAYQTFSTEPIEFTISEGQPYGAIIDRDSVQINDTAYTFSNNAISATTSSTITNGIDTTSISVVVKNVSGAGATIGTFTWEVFIGDQPNPLTRVNSQNVPIKLVPGTQTNVPFQLLNPLPIEYTVVGTLNTKNSNEQSVIISFSEDDSVIARSPVVDPLDFATFTSSAREENSTDMLFCYTPTKILQYQNPQLSFSVANTAGVIGEYSVDLSELPYSPTSIVDRFSFPSAPGAYTVDVTLMDSDVIVSTSTLHYLNESPTIESSKGIHTGILLATGVGLFGLFIFGLLLYRRSLTKLEN
jgi:hypothetical protein